MKESTKVKVRAFFRTVKQAAFVWMISSLPLICASGWQAWEGRLGEDERGFFSFVAQNLNAGEAFLFVSAFVAPFFWVTTSYNDARRQISWFAVWMLASVLAIVGSALFFAAHRSSPESSIAQIPYAGLALYVLGFLIWVRSLHADNALNLPELEEPGETSRKRVAKISEGLGGES